MVNPVDRRVSNSTGRANAAARAQGEVPRLGDIGGAAQQQPARVGVWQQPMSAARNALNRLGTRHPPGAAGAARGLGRAGTAGPTLQRALVRTMAQHIEQFRARWGTDLTADELQLTAQWQAWATEPHVSDERLKIAVPRLMDCLRNEMRYVHLDLSGLRLTSLPDAWPPAGLQPDGTARSILVIAARNPLSTDEIVRCLLATRQSAVTGISFSLPPLPTIRQQINQLNLARGTELSRAEQQLVQHWANWLQAAHQPGELCGVAVMRLMECLGNPSSTSVDLSGLGLATLPDHWPPHLTELNISSNDLVYLNQFPDHVQTVDARHNRVGAWPGEVVWQPSSLDIQLDHNELSEEQVQQLRALMGQAFENRWPLLHAYLNPPRPPQRVVSAAPVASALVAASQATGLVNAVAQWLPAEQAQRWASFEEDTDGALAHVLNKFTTIPIYCDGGTRRHFQASVVNLLNRMMNSAELRRDCFAVSQENLRTCVDGITLVYCQMESALLADQVRQGEFNDDLPKLFGVLRQLYRRSALEKITSVTVASMKRRETNTRETVEVFFAYLALLNGTLNLGFLVNSVYFPQASRLTEDDLNAAARQVRAEERLGFPNYVLNESELLRIAFETLNSPETVQAMNEARVEAVCGDEFRTRVAARLAEQLLPSDPAAVADAQRQAGLAVGNEMAVEAQLNIVCEFLSARGVPDPMALLRPLP